MAEGLDVLNEGGAAQMDDSRIAQLTHYISRGWALVPLHDVSGGSCSCSRGPSCKSAGKHPIVDQWQRPEHLVVTPDALTRWLASRPAANWGLATGVVSGVWCVDYDPNHVTDHVAAAATFALLQAAGTWSQRTGSGGQHWLFALPEDFVPNNSAKRLPAGFDVRGARRGEVSGGMIVLAPSVSGMGPYLVLQDGPVRAAPAEVVGLVRPAPPRERAAAGPVVLTSAVAEQIGRYVLSGLDGEIGRLREAPDGTRNNTAITTAFRCVELANTGLVSRESVQAAWWAAGKAHPLGTHVPDAELLGVWGRAERHVGDRPADLSGVGGPAGWMGGVGIGPFAAGGAAPSLGQSGSPGGHALRGALQGALQGVAGQVTGVTEAEVDPVEAMLAAMLDVEQLRALPPPQPLINGVLDLDTTAWLIGQSGSYKSFVMLDLAAHVGLGRSWRGHDVRQGEVIYIAAEGARGMRLRVDAWEREHGPMKGVRFLPMPVQANGPQWGVLVQACRRVGPVMVIVDTQARVTIGLDENSNSDMSTYAERVDEIKRATGACVVTVHHLGRNGTNARGASAIDGAQDAELRVHRTGAYQIELHMDKQKDQEEAPPITIRLRRSGGGTDPDTGRDLSSLVLDHTAETPVLAGAPKVDVQRHRALLLFQVVADVLRAGGEGITREQIGTLFRELPEIAELAPATRRSAWHRAWALLLSRGRVMRYGTSQRFSVFAPPDGAADGLITMNDGSAEDMPPVGWQIHWPESDRPDTKS